MKPLAVLFQRFFKVEWSESLLILLIASTIAILANQTFLLKTLAAYPDHHLFIFAIFTVYLTLLFLLLRGVSLLPYYKPIFIFIILFSALQAYVTDSFGIVGDQIMIQNILLTNFDEARDTISLRLILYFVLLGVIPSLIISKIKIKKLNPRQMYLNKMRDIGLAALIIFVIVISFSKSFATFFREHKPIRYYANPVFFFYSAGKLIGTANSSPTALTTIGLDAKLSKTDNERELIILVLGETARADRFSLNGYSKETNPRLKDENVISFKDVYSCGTSTATSVPCMFSIFGRRAFDHNKSDHTENLLDVLHHTGDVHVLWRDNNSDSKGVANRVVHQDFKTPKNNKVCDVECRDIGMLDGLQEYVDQVKAKDIFIVLHQMGNHGPAYFKRYPKEFEVFKPACHSNDLGDCSNEEISNAYDNAILYTDFFLSKVIEFLKANDSKFETAMFYISDHGESLGENGIYLHGLPYTLAPIEQKKVPLIMWFGKDISEDIDITELKSKLDQTFTHDNIFHTVLGLMEIETKLYDKSKDILVHKE